MTTDPKPPSAPETPRGSLLCVCGHAEHDHPGSVDGCRLCGCDDFTSAPAPAPPPGDAELAEALRGLVEWAAGRDVHGRNEAPSTCGYCASMAAARKALAAYDAARGGAR